VSAKRGDSQRLIVENDCTCPKKNCRRHGDCEACKEHHLVKGKLPYCKRDKDSSKKVYFKVKIIQNNIGW
jgi:hypothetical protein